MALKSHNTVAGKREILDSHPWIPVAVLLTLPFAMHLPLWLLGWSTSPIWFVSGVTHSLHLLPGYPFIDPNAGFTSQALGHLVAWDWLHGIVPWWNPYTGIGMPLAGELQPQAFFLPFNLLLLLRDGILWQQICMQAIAGLATYALLRELELTRFAALIGGMLFALNGTMAWTPGPAAVYCTIPFLPLLLLGIEKARKRNGHSGPVSVLTIGVAIGWSLLAGFPEPAFISGLFALCWGLYRLLQEPKRWPMARRAITGFVLGLMVAAPLLISFVDYMRQSDSFAIHKLGDLSLPKPAFSAFFMPFVYGPLELPIHSKQLSDIWACIGGYAGILIILLAVVGLSLRMAPRGLRILLPAWVLVCWLKTFGVQPVMWIVNHVPLLRQTAFLRYSAPSWELALILLAAFGLEEFRAGEPSRRWPFAVSIGLLGVAMALAWPLHRSWNYAHSLQNLMLAFFAIASLWAGVMLAAAALLWTFLPGEKRRITLACLLVLEAVVMFMAPELSSVRGNWVDMRAMQFLREHQGLSRTYTLGPLQPNYSAYFQIASINHNVLPVPKLWADYADGKLLPGLLGRFQGVVFWPGLYGGDSGEKALNRYAANYRYVGVRYLITYAGHTPDAFVPPKFTDDTLFSFSHLLRWSASVLADPHRPTLERWTAKELLKAGQEHGITRSGGSLQNPNAAPAGAMNAPLLRVASGPLQGAQRVYADSLIDIWELPDPAPYFQVIQGGPCALSEMQREGVTAECSAPATLLRRELYMPGWQVRINGAKRSPVQQQNIFQTAMLPAGRSEAHFHFAPPYVDLGWAASLLGMAGLLWMAVLVASRAFSLTSKSKDAAQLN